MHKNFFHDALTYNTELIKGMLNFNNALLHAHAYAKLEGMTMPSNIDAQKIMNLPAFKKILYKDYDGFFWDFYDESRRLVLIDKACIKKLMLYMGICIHAKNVAQCVSQKDVLILQNGLGGEAFSFAVHRAQFMLGGINITHFDFLKHEHIYPKVVLSGVFAVHFCAHEFPQQLYNILLEYMQEFAMDHEIVPNILEAYLEGVPTNNMAPKEKQNLWFSMKKILLKEVDPQWKPYFNA